MSYSGWSEAVINGTKFYASAFAAAKPGSSALTERKMIIHFADFEECYPKWELNLYDIFFEHDPYSSIPYKNQFYNCEYIQGRPRVPYTPRPERRIAFSRYDYDTPIQELHPDTSEERRFRVVIDQIDTVKAFVVGRFAGRFYKDPSCNFDPNAYEEVIVEEGYFESILNRR